jgi:hypothetical protein
VSFTSGRSGRKIAAQIIAIRSETTGEAKAMKDLMKKRAEELALFEVCRKVLTADKELGRRSPIIEQVTTQCANRLVAIETTLIAEGSNGR